MNELSLAFIMFIALCFLFMFLWRNEQVLKWRLYAINKAADKALQILRRRKYGWMKCYEVIHSYPSHNQMLFDLTIWNFDAAYPGLDKKLERLNND